MVEERKLREASGTAYVVIRPNADLADAFGRWQAEALDRVEGTVVSAPGAHATLKAFGSRGSPLTPADEERIATAVEAWASGQGPIEMRAEGLGVLDDDETVVPIVTLARSATFTSAMRSLWDVARREGLAPGYSDGIGIEAWIPHLSLAYVDGPRGSWWPVFLAWVDSIDTNEVACVADRAELVTYDERGERSLGVFQLVGAQRA